MPEEILEPTPDTEEEDIVELATRPSTLDDLTVTLYSNNKQNSDYFLEAVGSQINSEFDENRVEGVTYKPSAASPGSRWDLIDELAETSDVVLMAYGDCGSCTTYTITDCIELEKRGIPTVCYTSDNFLGLGQYDAYHLGCPGLPIIDFEHPVAGLTREEVEAQRVTPEIVDETVAALTDDAQEVFDRYASRYSIDEFMTRPDFDTCTI
jgi:hypothetical protein